MLAASSLMVKDEKYFNKLLIVRLCCRSEDWKSENTLFTSGLRVCPNNPKVWYNLAKMAAGRASLSHLRLDFADRERSKGKNKNLVPC